MIMNQSGTRLVNDDVKRIVVEKNRLKVKRDALTDGLSPEALTANPLALVTKLPSLIEAFTLTNEIEKLNDSLVSEFIQRVADSDRVIGG